MRLVAHNGRLRLTLAAPYKPKSAPKTALWVIFPDGRQERIVKRDGRYRAGSAYSAATVVQIKRDIATFEPGATYERRSIIHD